MNDKKNCKPDRAGGDAHAGDADAPGAADHVLHGPTHQGCQQSYTASIQNLVPVFDHAARRLMLLSFGNNYSIVFYYILMLLHNCSLLYIHA